jgi:hypothetical protein
VRSASRRSSESVAMVVLPAAALVLAAGELP